MPRDVQVVPALAADPRLKAAQVRNADEQASAGSQPASDRGQCRPGILEMLQHMPERDDV
jgi:hypothetical protein